MFEILIAEEDPLVVDVLRGALSREGLTQVCSASSGRRALSMIDRGSWSLVILDVGLPDISGFDVAARIRQRHPDVSILFLSSSDSTADKLMGFGVGADDFVTKPFDSLEVVARARVLLRRNSARQQGRIHDYGRFEIRLDEGRLLVDGRDVTVPAREFRLLAFLAEHEGMVYSAAEIYRAVWGADPIGAGDHNTVSVHVRRLRERIERVPSNPELLVTVRGLGYKLAAAKTVAQLR